MTYTEDTIELLTKFILNKTGMSYHDSEDFACEVLDLLVDHGELSE